MHPSWTRLGRSDLIAFGRNLVSERIEQLGCAVTPPPSPVDGRLSVRTTTGRSLEVFVSTQRIGGYTFWTKRRLQPAIDRIAVLVLLSDAPVPELYLVPSTEWLDARAPLTDRDYEGRKSEPEYGIEITSSTVPLLARYNWSSATARKLFA